MDTCAFASVANAAAWAEKQSAIGFPRMVNGLTNRAGSGAICEGFAKNVRHDVRTDWPVSTGTWSAVFSFQILNVPVSNVFRSGLSRGLAPVSRSVIELALHAVLRRVDITAVGQGEGDLAAHAGAAAGGVEARGRADAFAAEGVVGRGEDLDLVVAAGDGV